MKDLIERQDAIDVIQKWKKYETTEGLIDRIKALPSAQPEIIRCKDCKHRLSSLYCEAWNNSPGFPCIGDEMFCSMAERRTDDER